MPSLSLSDQIQAKLPKMSQSLQKFAHWLWNNADSISHQSMKSCAKAAGVSEPTVMRFCKFLNYSGFQAFREKLNKEKSLIGFVGAPWTLLIYMLGVKEGKKEIDYEKINKKEFEVNLILDKLNDYLCIHIENQINAGADVIQIFDSWAGLILKEDLPNFCYIPNLKIVNFCKEKKIPVMCFPKGLKEKYMEFNNIVKPDAISLDYDIDPTWVKQNLTNVVLQGGLDPKLLLLTEKEILNGAKKYLDIFKDLPYIFNLGHGLLPETDPDKVSKLIKFYREY